MERKRKNPVATQSMLFDVPATKGDYEKTGTAQTGKSKTDNSKRYESTLVGLNAVVEGRSSKYANFSEYIKSLNSY